MARSVDAIEADLEALRLQGVHGNAKEMVKLKLELQAAQDADSGAEMPPQQDPEPMEVGPVTAEPGAAAEVPALDPADFDSDEWQFIQKACAEVQTPKGGIASGLVKTLYNTLKAKVRIWRLAREIVGQVGIGGEWPQWSALGRNNSTGELLPPPEPEPEPVLSQEEFAAAVTEGGMPVRDAAPSPEAIREAVTGGSAADAILADIESRPEPAKT